MFGTCGNSQLLLTHYLYWLWRSLFLHEQVRLERHRG